MDKNKRMGRNGKFPVIDGRSWEDSIRMARTEPNLVREAIRKQIAIQAIKTNKPCSFSQ